MRHTPKLNTQKSKQVQMSTANAITNTLKQSSRIPRIVRPVRSLQTESTFQAVQPTVVAPATVQPTPSASSPVHPQSSNPEEALMIIDETRQQAIKCNCTQDCTLSRFCVCRRNGQACTINCHKKTPNGSTACCNV